MSKEYPTTSFIVTEPVDSPGIELWVDWIPAVDSNPHAPLRARLDGKDLLVEPLSDVDPDHGVRRVLGLKPDVIDDLKRGLVWRFCGPSGVLATHRLVVH